MSKSPRPLRAFLIIGAIILVILLVSSLLKYESLAASILRWIDQLKAGK
ncbi:hypothetical protein [Spirosoma pollinicola]|nr:hypothetical protein [Spirosoma pollinicola]